VKTFWRGPTRNVPFRVDVVPETGKSLSVSAALNHKPLLPRGLMMLVALLLLLALLLVLLLTTLLERQPVLTAGPSPVGQSPSASSTASAGTSATGSPGSGTPAGSQGNAPQPASTPAGGHGTSAPSSGATAFTIDVNAYPGSPSTPQLFSYVIPKGDRVRLFSVRLTDSNQDSGSLRVLLGSTTLVSFDLAQVRDLYYAFPSQPVAKSGQQVTLAVSCADPSSVCSLTGAFSQTAGS
jgi:hypothetical protein